MRNFVQPGEVLTVAAPTGGVVSGDLVIVGLLFGVAAYTAAEAAEVEIHTGGVFDFPKTSAQAWAAGAAIYWDATAKVMTTVSTSNTKVGVAAQAAANPSGTGRVRLNPAF